MSSPSLTVTGRIVFLKEGGDRWGRESFSMTEHADGRTFRACMKMDDYDTFREANWSMSLDWAPLEGFARETVRGETVAHSWFRMDGNAVECEAYTKQLGRVSQRLNAGERVQHFGPHVLLSDCMVSSARRCTEPGVEKKIVCVTNSVADYGRGGYMAHVVHPLVTYLGREPIKVVAGEFEAEHFAVRWSDAVPTYSHFWVLGKYFLPLRLKGAWGPVSYELAEISLSRDQLSA